jgi:hypothetical protein
MKIELKNVKHSVFASHETDCFNAAIYIDGKKAGTVENSGQGGCDLIHPRALGEQIEAYAKTLPQRDVSNLYNDGQVHTLPECAETLIAGLLHDHLVAVKERRLCSKSTCYRQPAHTYGEGEYHQIKSPFTPEIKAKLAEKYGSMVFILNEKYA